MMAMKAAVLAGLRRGWIEFRLMLESWMLVGYGWPSVMALVVLYFMRDRTVPGTDFSLGSAALPGLLVMNIVFGGMSGLAMALVQDRSDGTLLRVKCLPGGMVSYLTAKLSSHVILSVAMLVLVLVPCMFIFEDFGARTAGQWAWLVLMFVVGLLALLPIGALLGAQFDKVQNLSMVTMLLMVLAAISGIFYPITSLPGWLHVIGKAFPLYWLGRGLRSALLPDAMKVAETGGEWQRGIVIAVLLVWAVAGITLAPRLLRSVAKRENGSRLDVRRRSSVQWG